MLKIKSLLSFLVIVFMLGITVGSALAYEKAEVIDGDLIVMKRVPSAADQLAISLGKNNFQTSEPMSIELLIEVPCDRNVVSATSEMRGPSQSILYKQWTHTLTVPASCFSWYIKHSTTAPPISGQYTYSYKAIDSRTGGVAVQESKPFTVTGFLAKPSCPADSCSDWKEISQIPHGKIISRSCTDYDQSSESCPSKTTQESQIICDFDYYISGNSCISDAADSDSDGTIDRDDSSENKASDFLESLSLQSVGGFILIAVLIVGIFMLFRRVL